MTNNETKFESAAPAGVTATDLARLATQASDTASEVSATLDSVMMRRQLVQIAGDLIDAMDDGIDELDDQGRTIRAGMKAGISKMCLAANHAIARAIPAAEGAHAVALYRLDAYMAASGYGADHPWRQEIASAGAAPSACRRDSLQRVARKLRKAGAVTPIPPAAGTIDSAITNGMSLALALIERELDPAAPAPSDMFPEKREPAPAVDPLLVNLAADLSARTPKVPVDDIMAAMADLEVIAAVDGQAPAVAAVCKSARSIIERMLPHAMVGVEA